MGIFSLPGLGQNYTFFGVNPSTGFADTFYKAQANKRANDAAYAAKKKDDGMDDYLKNVYLKNTNILPIYADKVKGEVAGWIASTNELKSKYGTGYQNSTPFVTSYMDLITKLNNYQQSSKAISDNLNDANKNPDKFVFKQDYNDALQKNDFNRLAELTGNPNAIYNNGMALDPAYNPIKAVKDINSMFTTPEIDIQNRKPLGNGIMSYDNVTISNKKRPEFESLARQYFANNRAAQVAHNGDVNSFLEEAYKLTPGDVPAEKQMNIAKPGTTPSNTFGGGYFNNGKVTVSVSDGNTIAFDPKFTPPPDVIISLKKQKTLSNQPVRDDLIKRGFSPAEIDAIAKGSSTTLSKRQGFSWKINKLYNIAFNQGDSKSQNFQTLSGGTVINAKTGDEEKVKDVSGTVQGVAERELEDGNKEYYAIIKGRDTEKNGVILPGKTTYVKYDKNIASQIEGATTDKDKSAFNLYKDGTIGGGKPQKSEDTQKPIAAPKNANGKIIKDQLKKGVIYYDGSVKMIWDGSNLNEVK
jgi:hypothetical protein